MPIYWKVTRGINGQEYGSWRLERPMSGEYRVSRGHHTKRSGIQMSELRKAKKSYFDEKFPQPHRRRFGGGGSSRYVENLKRQFQPTAPRRTVDLPTERGSGDGRSYWSTPSHGPWGAEDGFVDWDADGRITRTRVETDLLSRGRKRRDVFDSDVQRWLAKREG